MSDNDQALILGRLAIGRMIRWEQGDATLTGVVTDYREGSHYVIDDGASWVGVNDPTARLARRLGRNRGNPVRR